MFFMKFNIRLARARARTHHTHVRARLQKRFTQPTFFPHDVTSSYRTPVFDVYTEIPRSYIIQWTYCDKLFSRISFMTQVYMLCIFIPFFFPLHFQYYYLKVHVLFSAIKDFPLLASPWRPNKTTTWSDKKILSVLFNFLLFEIKKIPARDCLICFFACYGPINAFIRVLPMFREIKRVFKHSARLRKQI